MDGVVLRKFEVKDIEVLGNYALPEMQKNFTILPNAWFQLAQKNVCPVTIWYDSRPAGFFVLDFGDGRYDYCKNEKSVLLRALSVNPSLQGNGIGKAAMMQVSAFVKENFPAYNEIVLGVNENNIAAYHLYLKCGFADTGHQYLGGKNGPQFIMSKKI